MMYSNIGLSFRETVPLSMMIFNLDLQLKETHCSTKNALKMMLPDTITIDLKNKYLKQKN